MTSNYADIARKLTKLRRNLPVLIGNEVVNFALDNFDKQGFDTGAGIKRWADRSEPDPRPGGAVLVGRQGGRLKRSIRRTRTTATSVTIGSDVVYSGIHNEGGQIRVTVTPRSRRFFWAMHYATGLDFWRGMALTKKKVLTVNIPERRFLGDSKALDRRIVSLIEREIEKCFK
ncbi:MAG: phage virion morphogenesis protein [Cyclobacteriaceae bacterium]